MSDSTEIHLVRHGETGWNAAGRIQGQAESRLTPRGHAQARALGLQIDLGDFDAVYCSSSVRTRQTLDGVLGGRECQARFRDNLREIHLGPWQGLLRTEVAARWPQAFDDFKNHPDRFELEGAEPFGALQQRGLDALEGIAAEHAGSRVLVVSHGALIKAVYCALAGVGLDALWAPPLADNCARFIVAWRPAGDRAFVAYRAGGDALAAE